MKENKNIMSRPEICICVTLLMTLVYGCNSSTLPSGELESSEGSSAGVLENDFSSSSEAAEYDFPNLDRNETDIIENMPVSGVWKILTVDMHYLNDTSVEAVQAVVEGFGKEFSYDRVTCNLSWFNGYDYSDANIPYLDMTASDYEKIDYIRYVSDDFYMDMGNGGMIELYFPENVRGILGDEITETWSWRPFYVGNNVETYYMSENPDFLSKEYMLNGLMVSIEDASENALNYLSNASIPYIYSSVYDYELARVEVYQFHEEQYGYLLRYGMSYDGVPILTNREMASNDNSLQDGKKIKGSVVSNSYRLAMLSGTTVDWIWDSALAYGEPTVTEIKSELLTYDEACQVASELLSAEHVFKLEDAELSYVMIQEYDTETESYLGAKVRPAWTLTLSDLLLNSHRYMYIYVAADTGEVYVQYN